MDEISRPSEEFAENRMRSAQMWCKEHFTQYSRPEFAASAVISTNFSTQLLKTFTRYSRNEVYGIRFRQPNCQTGPSSGVNQAQL
jgi:hypothetical protein